MSPGPWRQSIHCRHCHHWLLCSNYTKGSGQEALRPTLSAERGQALHPARHLQLSRILQQVHFPGPAVQRSRGQAPGDQAPPRARVLARAPVASHRVASHATVAKTEKPSSCGLLSLKRQSSSSGMQPPITQKNSNTQQQQQEQQPRRQQQQQPQQQ
ncbi:hypothetical protein TSAR_010899 [Trichomalopsis sarcophagae]|uniref:Uncharacterized protein n=1 Tax=Trichomalopsis sarcophagae TaxID=543379 RepID=A0A232EE20_9HYME|nr:hypothetical protein TSAR_010899 [Trichomalopsis sarcophagae]